MIWIQIKDPSGRVLYEARIMFDGKLPLPDIGEKSLRFNGRIYPYPVVLNMVFLPPSGDKVEKVV